MKSKGKNGKMAAKKAVHKHEKVMHPGKPLTKLPGRSAVMVKPQRP